jgi:hypothetical protein
VKKYEKGAGLHGVIRVFGAIPVDEVWIYSVLISYCGLGEVRFFRDRDVVGCDRLASFWIVIISVNRGCPGSGSHFTGFCASFSGEVALWELVPWFLIGVWENTTIADVIEKPPNGGVAKKVEHPDLGRDGTDKLPPSARIYRDEKNNDGI